MTEITSPVEKMPEEPTPFVRVLQVVEAVGRIGSALMPLVTSNDLLTVLAAWQRMGRPSRLPGDEEWNADTLRDVKPKLDKVANACLDVVCLIEPFLSDPVEAGGDLPEGVPFVN